MGSVMDRDPPDWGQTESQAREQAYTEPLSPTGRVPADVTTKSMYDNLEHELDKARKAFEEAKSERQYWDARVNDEAKAIAAMEAAMVVLQDERTLTPLNDIESKRKAVQRYHAAKRQKPVDPDKGPLVVLGAKE